MRTTVTYKECEIEADSYVNGQYQWTDPSNYDVDYDYDLERYVGCGGHGGGTLEECFEQIDLYLEEKEL